MKIRLDFRTTALICLLALLTNSGKIMAQDTLRNPQDSLEVYNLFVSFNPIAQKNIEASQSPSSDALVNLNVGFKVNFPGSADEIFIMAGSDKDSSDYQFSSLNVMKENGINVIYQNNSKIAKFWKRDASYSVIIPTRDISRIKWVTVYAKDKLGRFSKRGYFNVQ